MPSEYTELNIDDKHVKTWNKYFRCRKECITYRQEFE
jgi:hypothetical protein